MTDKNMIKAVPVTGQSGEMMGDDYRSMTARSEDLSKENEKLRQEIKYLKAMAPPECLDETLAEVLGEDGWVDYIDSDGHKRDPDGVCPAELENAFVDLVTGLRRFFKEHQSPYGPQTFSNHDSTSREVRVDQPNEFASQLEISPLQWEIMIALTRYLEHHVIDAADIVWMAERG